jgi:hypothetical protein
VQFFEDDHRADVAAFSQPVPGRASDDGATGGGPL